METNGTWNVTDYSDQVDTAPNMVTGGEKRVFINSTPVVIKKIEIAIGIVGMLVNILVIVVIVNSKKMKNTNTNQYIINQNCTDGSLAAMLIFITQFENDGRDYRGVGDVLYCVLWVIRLFFFGPLTSSTYNMIMMTVERYLAVVKPIWHKKNVTKRIVRLSLVFAWFFGPVYQMLMKLPTTFVHSGECKIYQFHSPLARRVVAVIFVTVTYLFPLICLFSFYGQMARTLRKRVKPSQFSSSTPDDDKAERARKNVIKTLLFIGGAFIMCKSWSSIQFMLFNLGVPIDMTSSLYNASILLSFANCAIYPWVYFTIYKQFQEGWKELVGRITRGKIDMFGNSQPKESISLSTS